MGSGYALWAFGNSALVFRMWGSRLGFLFAGSRAVSS